MSDKKLSITITVRGGEVVQCQTNSPSKDGYNIEVRNVSKDQNLKVEPYTSFGNKFQPRFSPYSKLNPKHEDSIITINKLIHPVSTKRGLKYEMIKDNKIDFKNLKDSYAARPSGDNLMSVLVEKKDISGVDFSGSYMPTVKFRESRCVGVDFFKADVRLSIFKDCNLVRVNFSEANFSKSIFVKCALQVSRFSGSNLTETVFDGCDLRSADFTSAMLYNAVLRDVKLSGATFKGADLKFADLSGLDFDSVDLSNADLRGADITGTKFTSKTNLNGTLFELQGHSRLNYCTDTSFVGANLSKSVFGKTVILNADFTDANLSGLKLGAGGLPEAIVKGANLRNTDFSETDLTGVNLSEAADITGVITPRDMSHLLF